MAASGGVLGVPGAAPAEGSLASWRVADRETRRRVQEPVHPMAHAQRAPARSPLAPAGRRSARHAPTWPRAGRVRDQPSRRRAAAGGTGRGAQRNARLAGWRSASDGAADPAADALGGAPDVGRPHAPHRRCSSARRRDEVREGTAACGSFSGSARSPPGAEIVDQRGDGARQSMYAQWRVSHEGRASLFVGDHVLGSADASGDLIGYPPIHQHHYHYYHASDIHRDFLAAHGDNMCPGRARVPHARRVPHVGAPLSSCHSWGSRPNSTTSGRAARRRSSGTPSAACSFTIRRSRRREACTQRT